MPNKVFLTFNVGDTDDAKITLAEVDAELIAPKWENEDDLIRICSDPDVVAMMIGSIVPVTKRVIDSFPNMKILSRLGIGYNNIDVKAATARGIPVSIVDDYCIDEVSDHAMAFLLVQARRIIQLNQTVKSGNWVSLPTVRSNMFRLDGMILGVVGAGKIGGALIRKAQAFNIKTIIYDPYLSKETAESMGAELVDFSRLLFESDFISIHAPLTEETKHLFDLEAFKKMKPTAYLINNARGGLVDENALYTALKEGYIAGAALDVTDPEPPKPDNPLFTLDNVLLNGHSSWYTEESVVELREKGIAAIIAVLKGERPKTLVNPEVMN